jgi:16S rRNA (cytosine1402-N4)-methyltransferase
MNEKAPHIPVMPAESLEYLAAAAGKVIVDGTFGAGGHSRLLLAAGARVIAIDQDPSAAPRAAQLEAASEPGAFRFLQGDFRDLPRLLALAGEPLVDGILRDLGVSSMQLDERERGFAFRQDGPLDMRMSASGPSAADVVAEFDEAELAALIYRYGEERHSRRLARAIVVAREEAPITTTGRLAAVIQAAYPGGGYRREHPARRTFQALRIHVNDELGALEQVMADAPALLRPGGRLVVISYHSLEDRIVKHALRSAEQLEVLTRRPLTATEAEQEANPRARSAKLRAAARRVT